MRDFEDQHRDLLVLDIADQTVIANPISPKSPFVAVERFAPLPGILCGL
jgi:hypothetical protein